MTAARRDPRNIFINAPFDDDYEPLFEALVFTILACGYNPRCALEEDDSGDIRLDKLERLIRQSARSIHDLSRIEVGDNDLPRFNMPFELGLCLGLKRFGRDRKDDAIKIMVREPYRLPAYLSDLAGNDPSAHKGQPDTIIKLTRDFLHETPDGTILQGPARYIAAYRAFNEKLPEIADAIDYDRSEISGFKAYRTFVHCATEYLKATAKQQA